MAYRLSQGSRPLVVRGGYSIFQFEQPLRFYSGYGSLSLPQLGMLNVSPDSAETSPDGLSNYLLRSTPTIIAGQNSSNIINPNDATGIAAGTGSVYFMDPHHPSPRAQEWNVTFEKEILANTAFSFGSVGTHGSNLGTYNSFNDPTPPYIWHKTTGLPLPTGANANVATNPYDNQVYGQMQEYQNIGWSNTQNFKVELEHRYSKGYAYQVFYVLSNSLVAGGTSWYGDTLLGTNQYMPGTVTAILDATSGGVGVLEGWGGMYLLELVPAGISGVMPSLSLADLLARIYRLAKGERQQEACDVFAGVLPQIVFRIQNMELYHQAEKRLLAARGIIPESVVRELRLELSAPDAQHIEFLNSNILALLDKLNMPRCPSPLQTIGVV